MNPETLSRWQFAITTVYHFLIVPASIGLSVMVASFQTAAYRTGKRSWDRAARFYGKLLLITFAIGVATGIVQEFQFGMNWSAYSRFVGDIFGAPLAMEGLVAFFLESTFLGVWVFGRDKVSPRIHLASIWAAAIGTVLSAYFILAANSFMQHPVGWRFNPVTHRAELTSIWALLTNSTQLVTFPHTVLAAGMTVGGIIAGISAWHLRRAGTVPRDIELHRRTLRVGAVLLVVCGLAASGVGHIQGQVMTRQQPMKMAAAEALWHTTAHAPFSLFAVGDVNQGRNKVDLTIPDGLSLLATDRPSGTVQGVVEVNAAEQARYGPGSYIPTLWITYWCFRLMMGFGLLGVLIGLAFLIATRGGRLPAGSPLWGIAVWASALPFAANTAGWLFTETGRQPWLVYGLLKTADGVSPNIGTGQVLSTLIGFTLLYAALGVGALRLFVRISRQGPDADIGDGPSAGSGVDPLADTPLADEPLLVG